MRESVSLGFELGEGVVIDVSGNGYLFQLTPVGLSIGYFYLRVLVIRLPGSVWRWRRGLALDAHPKHNHYSRGHRLDHIPTRILSHEFTPWFNQYVSLDVVGRQRIRPIELKL